MEESQRINKEEEEEEEVEVRDTKLTNYISGIWRWFQQALRAILLYICFGYSTTTSTSRSITTPLIKNPTSNKEEDMTCNSDTNPTHSSQPAHSPLVSPEEGEGEGEGEDDPPTDDPTSDPPIDAAVTATTIARSKGPPRPPISRGGGGKTN